MKRCDYCKKYLEGKEYKVLDWRYCSEKCVWQDGWIVMGPGDDYVFVGRPKVGDEP